MQPGAAMTADWSFHFRPTKFVVAAHHDPYQRLLPRSIVRTYVSRYSILRDGRAGSGNSAALVALKTSWRNLRLLACILSSNLDLDDIFHQKREVGLRNLFLRQRVRLAPLLVERAKSLCWHHPSMPLNGSGNQ